MRKLTALLALLLVLVMVLGLVACDKNEPEETKPTETEAPAESKDEETKPEDTTPAVEIPTPGKVNEGGTSSGTLSYATSTFGQKFSPFFYTTAYDGEVVGLVEIGLLASDRGGAVINNGIQGETVNYNGTDYTYYGAGNVEVIQNDDGTVDYKLVMRDDIKFSDGEPANIDDVIFGIYVQADPAYDGSSTIYALPIKGIADYRNSMSNIATMVNTGDDDNLKAAGVTDEQVAVYKSAVDAAGEKFAQEIIDYVVANYTDDYAEAYIGATPDEVRADPALQTKLGMFLWGFDSYWEEGATAADYWAGIVDNYGGDIIAASDTESAGSSITDLIKDELGDKVDEFYGMIPVSSVDYIEGIERTSDYSMTVHMTEYDATAIYNMSFYIAPLHYYGDKAQYDYENHKFGFTKGDLSGVKAKNTQPLGAGPYTYEGYANGVVTMKANPNYFLGTPKIEYVLLNESVDADYVPGIVSGKFDVAVPSINDETLNAIKDANSNGEIVGDAITTVLVDYRGYGYIGINADLVNTGTPGSDESKALRKGFMTLFSVYRDTVVNSYYGDRATVIQYPISNTSWAAPQPADVGYKNAYSVDVDGNAIYTAAMTEEEKYAAALEAAIGYFKAAGLEYDEAEGKFKTEKSWEIMIPGQGTGDHPAYGIATAASTALEGIGITLQVNDVGTSTWNNALEGNTAQMWAAAWQASVDPDMTQVYHSSNAHGNGTNSNHYSVDDAALDDLIKAGRSSADTEERKSIYKEAMEIILDWGCELPTYQRKDCSTFSTARIDIDTIPQDMTPYWGWAAELDTMIVK